MKVEYIEHSGSDLTVVNAARVSFNKTKMEMNTSDERLISYLAKHNHWTPFAHCFLTLRITVPIYVARQLMKHQVGLTVNEVSRRYVDEPPEVYLRDTWNHRADNKKQGKGENFATVLSDNFRNAVAESMRKSVDTYQYLIAMGVAPEQARGVLPQAMFTEYYWSGSLAAFARVVKLRDHPDAQEESRIVATKIAALLYQYYPVSAEALLAH